MGSSYAKALAVDDLPLCDNHIGFPQPVQLVYQRHQILEGHVPGWPVLSSLATLTALPSHLACQLGGNPISRGGGVGGATTT